MEKLLSIYDIDNVRIKAFDGLISKNQEIQQFCVLNTNFTRMENACTCSHLKALEYFINNTEDNEIIIFEDDVSFEFLKFIPYNWSELIKKLPPNYAIIQLAITCDTGNVDNVLIKTDPLSKYYCSAAYMITRLAAQKILSSYYSYEFGKYDLSKQLFVTADSMIANSGSTYSIPIFTYNTNNSTIHPSHCYIHNKSKTQQLSLWKNIKLDDFDQENYFEKFPKK